MMVERETALSYHRYCETRPNYLAPASVEDLWARGEPVFRRRYLPLMPADKRAAILEIGCGCGEYLAFLQREGYENARGVDRDPEQIAAGQRLGVKRLEVGSAEGVLARGIGKFDCIVAIDVLEHIPKPEVMGFLGLVREAMAPGGRFLCQVPNLASFYRPLFYMDFTHETPFTASSLRQALRMAGFAAPEVHPCGPVVHGLKSGLRWVLWQVLSLGLRTVVAVEAGPREERNSLFTAAILAVAMKS